MLDLETTSSPYYDHLRATLGGCPTVSCQTVLSPSTGICDGSGRQRWGFCRTNPEFGPSRGVRSCATADSYPFAHEFLAATATRIINEVRGINRVVYDVTSKPPGTIEWE